MAGAGKKTSNLFMWLLMGLLIVALAGFGANSLGGRLTSIGSVGKTDVSAQEYVNLLQSQIAQAQQQERRALSALELLERNIPQGVAAQLFSIASVTEEARVMGLSIGDAEVARQLQSSGQFAGLDGNFDREGYEASLRHSGMSPTQFEERMRANAASALLEQAVTSGLRTGDVYASTLLTFVAEERSARWAVIEEDAQDSEIAAPDTAALESFLSENATRFETPLTRRVTYAWLSPEMLLDEVQPDEDELRAIYDARADEFNLPERRLAERLNFSDTETALDARNRILSGDVTFDDLVAQRGLTLEDVNQGELSRDSLAPDLAEAVFAVTEPGISEPVETSLGSALYRINAVLEARVISFEDVRDDLAEASVIDRARRQIVSRVEPMEDLLAGGATIEELADETAMELGTLDFHPAITDGIAGYGAFRNAVAAASEDDFAEIIELEDGGVFALRLDEIVPSRVPALDDIRAEVETAWTNRQIRDAQIARAEEMIAALDAGTPPEDLGLEFQEAPDVSRRTPFEGPPEGARDALFELAEGARTVVADDETVAILELTKITPPDPEAQEAEFLLTQFQAAAAQELQIDVFEAYRQSVQARLSPAIDQRAIDEILRQMTGAGYGGGHGGM